jgi:hypothetical protein
MASRADKYRAKAAECRREAHQARNEIMKRVCQDAARSWVRLAALLDESADHRPTRIYHVHHLYHVHHHRLPTVAALVNSKQSATRHS